MKKAIKERKLQVETLTIIILVTLIVTIGIIIFNNLTTNRKITNFTKQVNLVLGASKNAYIAFSKEGLDFLATSSDGSTQSMCITVEGLEKNGLIDNTSDLDGYVIIELLEKPSYKIWLTNKSYKVEELDIDDLNNLKLDSNLNIYDKEKYSEEVQMSYEGSKKYNQPCISKKLIKTPTVEEVPSE